MFLWLLESDFRIPVTSSEVARDAHGQTLLSAESNHLSWLGMPQTNQKTLCEA